MAVDGNQNNIGLTIIWLHSQLIALEIVNNNCLQKNLDVLKIKIKTFLLTPSPRPRPF